jgi:hypothetical protein
MIELAASLRAGVERAAKEFRSWSDARASRDRGPGKWVRKEILGHLIDSAANNHQRFVRAQLDDPFVGPAYDQVAWVAVHRYRERAWPELVDLWVALNLHLAAVIERVPPDRLATPCTVADNGPRPLEWWIRDYLRHLEHHLGQLQEA